MQLLLRLNNFLFGLFGLLGLLDSLLSDAGGRVGDLVYVAGGERVTELGSAGLDEEGGGAFELEEELFLSSRRC